MKYIFSLILVLIFLKNAFASHTMGGELTYKCVGGNSYIFELVFYRDCNGAEVNTVSENLRVWNHPSLTSITLPFVNRFDVSPDCNPLPGYASKLECGVGSAGGNGVGAIERVLYRSLPIQLVGIPPVAGWIFTYENYSRSNSLTNISNPSSFGITLAAKMFATPNMVGNGFSDSSPQFLQEPFFVSCSGTPYIYNMNAIDPDLDSVCFDFGIPYDHFPGLAYNPPISPGQVQYEPGFSYTNPTPGTSLDPSNIPASINPLTGELSFTSNTVGNYLIKIRARSYRQGSLISEVEREMQIIILPCSSTNTFPVVPPPFAGSYSTTVNAGDFVSFSLNATDNEFLQDGTTPQKLYLTASGPMFGAGLTLNTGCDIEPCATLNSALPIIGTQQVSATFSWQTSCDHLVNQYGIVSDVIPYNFVFKVQDDYCPVPKVSYVTVTIYVVNPGVIQPTQIKCIETLPNGDLTIHWNQVSNPENSFVEYQLHSLEDGQIASFPDITSTSHTLPSGDEAKNYFVSVKSGCNGNMLKYSDTIANIYLNLINPSNGTAFLQWNKPKSTPLNSYNSHYRIYREYPSGTFSLIDSTLYSTTNYKDTIDICQAFLSYKVILPTTFCEFTSNTPGDNFEDMLTPNIPVLYSVGIDTATSAILIDWNENQQPDTYGYVIYTIDDSGFLVELDTVWGLNNTSYSYFSDLSQGPFSYSVAAFDSCYTTAVPITFQTSAKSPIQTTMKIQSMVSMCEKKVILNWTNYVGQVVQEYRIYSKHNGLWNQEGITIDTTFEISLTNGDNYCYVIEAVFINGYRAFSDVTCITLPTVQLPAFHYFKLASIENQKVELFDYIDESVGIQEIIFHRMNYSNTYEEIGRVPADGNTIQFTDYTADVKLKPWQYLATYTDSCGNVGEASNFVRTIFVSGVADEIRMINNVQWNPYLGFDGSIIEYRIFRGPNGIFDENPIAVVSGQQLYYEDDVSAVDFNGQICYRIEAVEALNFYNFSEVSQSNDHCFTYAPLIYIPNSFTPDGDGLNDYFLPVLSNIESNNYNLLIFNRWGQVIFESTNLDYGWDGRIQSTGFDAMNDTFMYQVQVIDANGIKISKKGFVSLIR
ncbi:MAG: gliding motility-associated C-terminal domain-containing protein [Bacteroidota bacterium]